MTPQKITKRECERFVVFGATLRYKKEAIILGSEEYSEDLYPILDLSLGGLRFVSQNQLKKGTRITLKLLDPYEKEFLVLKGEVKWGGLHSGQSYPYQIGVQFQPYGQKRGQNPPECRDKLVKLESQFGGK